MLYFCLIWNRKWEEAELRKIQSWMKYQSRWMLLAMVAAILITRAVCLQHEMEHHPDEHVFYKGAASLKEHLLDPSIPFEEVKEYPEGAYLFHVPFQMIAECVEHSTGLEQNPQLYGRIAAVFYFAAGSIIGWTILQNYLKGSKLALACYALIMVFSLLHIEQSRYGTGDSISFFLLMLLLLLCFKTFEATERGKLWLLASAGFCVGSLCAVKYPQAYFLLCPAVCLFLTSSRKDIIRNVLCMLAAFIAGLFLFSPKAQGDPWYIVRVCTAEMNAYVHSGNMAEMGGLKNHIASILLYHTLYADFPFSLPILGLTFLMNLKTLVKSQNKAKWFTEFALPVIMGVFALYNLFPRTLFIRTYYPYFCVASLYVAWVIGRLLERSREKKTFRYMQVLFSVFCILMVVRGGVLTVALTDDNAGERLQEIIDQIPDEKWQNTTLLGPGFYTDVDGNKLKKPVTEIQMEDYEAPFRIDEGNLTLSASLSHARAGEYIFKIVNPPLEARIAGWKQFQLENETYFLGAAYPEWYYPLFGYWIKGSTGAEYEFPANQIYFRPLGAER